MRLTSTRQTHVLFPAGLRSFPGRTTARSVEFNSLIVSRVASQWSSVFFQAKDDGLASWEAERQPSAQLASDVHPLFWADPGPYAVNSFPRRMKNHET